MTHLNLMPAKPIPEAETRPAPAPGQERVDVFKYAQNKNLAKMYSDENVRCFEFQAPVGASLEELQALAPHGSKSNWFEIQTDSGVWECGPGARVLRPTTAKFRTWEQMEADELAGAAGEVA